MRPDDLLGKLGERRVVDVLEAAAAGRSAHRELAEPGVVAAVVGRTAWQVGRPLAQPGLELVGGVGEAEAESDPHAPGAGVVEHGAGVALARLDHVVVAVAVAELGVGELSGAAEVLTAYRVVVDRVPEPEVEDSGALGDSPELVVHERVGRVREEEDAVHLHLGDLVDHPAAFGEAPHLGAVGLVVHEPPDPLGEEGLDVFVEVGEAERAGVVREDVARQQVADAQPLDELVHRPRRGDRAASADGPSLLGAAAPQDDSLVRRGRPAPREPTGGDGGVGLRTADQDCVRRPAGGVLHDRDRGPEQDTEVALELRGGEALEGGRVGADDYPEVVHSTHVTPALRRISLPS